MCEHQVTELKASLAPCLIVQARKALLDLLLEASALIRSCVQLRACGLQKGVCAGVLGLSGPQCGCLAVHILLQLLQSHLSCCLQLLRLWQPCKHRGNANRFAPLSDSPHKWRSFYLEVKTGSCQLVQKAGA